ncbi:MAG: hypothetical protein KY460_14995 [Actinobacteria bacterium]|nr:hypothetical protein [Actinomycetota bacterium]
MTDAVYLEQGPKRTFACAVDWPGWCRVARGDDAALAALAAYADRYGIIADEAGVSFPFAGLDADAVGAPFTVVETVPGSGATDFGAPQAIPKLDSEPLDDATAERHADLVAAGWRVFDRVVTNAPAQLRKGPRGGGRDRDEIVAHVAESERSYARSLGVRYTPTQFGQAGGQAAMRAEIIEVLRGASDGTPLVAKGWPARYAARRIAWHVLDHAWEIEDKSH